MILDEFTTGLNPESEDEMYKLVLSFAELIISVGNDASLEQYHKQVLQFLGGGKWKVSSGGAV